MHLRADGLKRFSLVALLLPALLTSCTEAARRGCVSSYRLPDFALLEGDLQAARERWAERGPRDYSYLLRFLGEAGGEPALPVTVRGGVPEAKSSQSASLPLTVEQHFDEVKRTIESAKKPRSCVQIEARYAGDDGHLTFLAVDTLEPGLMDGFGGLIVEGLQHE